MATDEAAEFYDMAESAEKYDMTMQDPPPISTMQLTEILQARLHTEGLSIDDLPMVDHAAEFTQVLIELGFSSAVERMAVRKAVREIRGTGGPVLPGEHRRPQPVAGPFAADAAAGALWPFLGGDDSASECGGPDLIMYRRLIEDIGGTGAGQQPRRRCAPASLQSPLWSVQQRRLGGCSVEGGASVDDDAASSRGAGQLPGAVRAEGEAEAGTGCGRGGHDATGARDRGGSAGGGSAGGCSAGGGSAGGLPGGAAGAWLRHCHSSRSLASSAVRGAPVEGSAACSVRLPPWAGQELDGSSEYAKVFMRLMERGGQGQGASSADEGRSHGAGRMPPANTDPLPAASYHPQRARPAKPPPAPLPARLPASPSAAAARVFGVRLRPAPPRVAAAGLVRAPQQTAAAPWVVRPAGRPAFAAAPRVVTHVLPTRQGPQAGGYIMLPMTVSSMPGTSSARLASSAAPAVARAAQEPTTVAYMPCAQPAREPGTPKSTQTVTPSPGSSTPTEVVGDVAAGGGSVPRE